MTPLLSFHTQFDMLDRLPIFEIDDLHALGTLLYEISVGHQLYAGAGKHRSYWKGMSFQIYNLFLQISGKSSKDAG